jgi:transposase-like protein
MAPRREGEQNPYWKRMEVVMKVYMGQMNVTEAARELGITRAYYYQLEEEMLRAALGAVTPSKRGPKTEKPDPEQVKRDEDLEKIRREKEILELKVKHLEDIQKEMIARGVGVLREKKDRARPAVGRRSRKTLHQRVQAHGALHGKGESVARRDREGVLRGDRPQPGQPLPMEGEGGRGQARPSQAGRGDRTRDGVGDQGV